MTGSDRLTGKDDDFFCECMARHLPYKGVPPPRPCIICSGSLVLVVVVFEFGMVLSDGFPESGVAVCTRDVQGTTGEAADREGSAAEAPSQERRR